MNARRFIALVVVFGCAVASLRPAHGEQDKPPAEQVERPLSFRRVLVPSGRLTEVPRNNDRYIPVDPDEFEQLVGRARAGTTDQAAPSDATIASAVYHARLEGDTLLDGEVLYEIVDLAGQPTFLPIAPCNLALGGGKWLAEPARSTQRAAVVGFRPEGGWEVLVQRSGTLRFAWSLRCHRDASGIIRFAWEVPPCATRLLLLDLPEEMIPEVEQGLVLAEGRSGETLKRWRIEFGGQRRLEVRIVPQADLADPRLLPRMRQSTDYHLTLAGLKLLTRLEVDVPARPLRQLSFTLDAGLELTGILDGDSPLSSRVVSAVPESDRTRVVVELDQPIQSVQRVLRLEALAPLRLDERWRLPGIRPEAAFWQEGTSTLSVAEPLVLEALVPDRSRLSKVGTLPAPRPGEVFQLQYYAADSGVEVRLGQRPAPLELDSGTTVELSGGEIDARVVADLKTTQSERFQFEADVGRNWIIDSVELDPADALAAWVPPEQQPDSVRKLTVHLLRALSPSKPVRLTVSARRLDSRGRGHLGIDDLMPLRLLECTRARELVWLRAPDPYVLKLSGGESLVRVDPEDLSLSERSRFAELPRDRLFAVDDRSADLRVAVEARQPSYSAELAVEADVSEGLLTETYRVRCLPESTRIDRVVVRFSPGRAEPLRWTLGAEEESRLVARRIPSEEEMWEVRLRPARSVPFEIRAHRASQVGHRGAISLISTPEATEQRATVVVGRIEHARVEADRERLVPSSSEVASSDRLPCATATYRYDRAATADASTPALFITPSRAEDPPPNAWIWSARLDSRYARSGSGQHFASLWIETSGAKQLEWALPPAAARDAVDVWVDGKPAALAQSEGFPEKLAVNLPSDRRFVAVSLLYRTAGEKLGYFTPLIPRFPAVDLPVFNHRWTVWLPPGCEARLPNGERLPTARRFRGESGGPARPLFGPLARSPAEVPFDPLRVSDYGRLLNRQPNRRAIEQEARALVERLGELVATDRAGQAPEILSWGQLLSDDRLQRLLDDMTSPLADVAVLVDRAALADLGVMSDTPAYVPRGNSPHRGVVLLEKAGLLLLVHPEAIVVTASGNAGLWHANLEPLRAPDHSSAVDRVLRWVRPGWVYDSVARAVRREPPHRFVPAAVWQEGHAGGGLPWVVSPPAGLEAADVQGWSAYRIDTQGEPFAQLLVVDRVTMPVVSCLAFLMVSGLAWWKMLGRPALLTTLGGLFGIGALLLPPTGAAVASGAMLAILFVFGLTLVVSRKGKPAVDAPTRQRGSVAGWFLGRSTVLLLALASIGPGQGTWAGGQEPESRPEPAAPVAFDVLIPVGADGRPTGDKYHVPEELAERLRGFAEPPSQTSQGWLIGQATYRGTLSRQPMAERPVLEDLKATFALHLLGPTARIRVPFGSEGPNLLPDGVLLDGQVVPSEFREGTLELDVTGPGPHQLDLLIWPSVVVGETVSRLDLAVPRLGSARLELTVPSETPPVEFPSALGEIRRDMQSDPPRLLAELGPTDRLSIAWEHATGRDAGLLFDTEELLWLKVRPGSVLVDARFRLHVAEGRVLELRLAVDPQLRVVPATTDSSTIAEVHTTPGHPRIVRLVLAEPVTENATVAVTFQLAGAYGVGKLPLPYLKLLDTQRSRRWMAVSVDPELAYEVEAPDAPENAVTDFQAVWPEAEAPPALAYRLASDTPRWSMATWPIEPATTADQSLWLGFVPGQVELAFHARLATSRGYAFQYRLSAPNNLEVTSATLRQGDRTLSSRFAQADDGTVTLFLTGPVAGEQDLSLRGRLRTGNRARLPLPVVRVDGVETLSSRIDIFRDATVQVDVVRPSGLAEAAPPTAEPAYPMPALPVHRFMDDPQGPTAATVVVSPNRPDLRAEQVTSLRSEGGGWEAEVELRLDVADGLLDQLGLLLPPEWAAPYRIEPATPFDVAELPDGKRRLVLRPSTPITGEYRVNISGRLERTIGGRLRVPHAVVDDCRVEKHLLVLPTQLELELVAWETQGLTETQLPEDFDPGLVGPEAFVAYEADTPSFEATLRTPKGEPQVDLLDVYLTWKQDGTCHGVALFDVRSGGKSECLLRLPPTFDRVQTTVSGVSQSPVQEGDSRWRVALATSDLPQRIEVLFECTQPPQKKGGRVEIEPPSLEGWPVGQTLWTVRLPPDWTEVESEEVEWIPPLQHGLVRLDQIASHMALAVPISRDQDDEAVGPYWMWEDRWRVLRRTLEEEYRLAGTSENGAAVAAELALLDERVSNLPSRVEGGEAAAAVPGDLPKSLSSHEVWRAALDPTSRVAHGVIREGTHRVVLEYRPLGSEHLGGRLIGVAGIAGLVLLVVVAVRGGFVHGFFWQWPGVAGTIAGLIWWLWLWPSALGWGIVLVSLVPSFRWGWRRRRASGSTIVPPSFSERR